MEHKEYNFNEAWRKLLDGKVIRSKESRLSYKIDERSRKNYRLKYFNPATGIWQTCQFLLPEEMFSPWYIA